MTDAERQRLAPELRECPNPECHADTAYLNQYAGRFVVCAGCQMFGPEAKSGSEAVRLWNILPRTPTLRHLTNSAGASRLQQQVDGLWVDVPVVREGRGD